MKKHYEEQLSSIEGKINELQSMLKKRKSQQKVVRVLRPKNKEERTKREKSFSRDYESVDNKKRL